MEDQSKFLEILQEIKSIAGSQQNYLTKEEIKKYLGDDSFPEEKMQAVYHYLGENHITVEGYEFVPDKQTIVEQKESGKNMQKKQKAVSSQKSKPDAVKGAAGKRICGCIVWRLQGFMDVWKKRRN